MPEELPVAIYSNEIVFDVGGRLHGVYLGNQVPEMICLPQEFGGYY
jgi:hypothetical protein